MAGDTLMHVQFPTTIPRELQLMSALERVVASFTTDAHPSARASRDELERAVAWLYAKCSGKEKL